MRPVFPETPVLDDNAFLRDQERRSLMSAHWHRGWRREFVRRADGAILRTALRECPGDCPCHDDAWWGDGR